MKGELGALWNYKEVDEEDDAESEKREQQKKAEAEKHEAEVKGVNGKQ